MRNNYTYDDLTPEQLKTANGCGSSFWMAAMFRLPRCLFPRISKACDCHDIGYQNGDPDDLDEKYALDAQLVEDIREIARKSGSVTRWYKMGIADLIEFALSTKLSEKCWKEASK